MRSSGILMHITSLPGPYGVGTMGKEAYRFVDFLEEAGQIGIGLGADCTVPADIDDDRLNWVRDAAIKFAQMKA